jgi:CDP-diacylglycerol---glycerol-3-phosphate 3-phosphatidyltransferase
MNTPDPPLSHPTGPRRRGRLALIAAALLLAAGTALWHTFRGPEASLRGGLQTAGVMVYLWARTLQLLNPDRRRGEPHPRPDLGAADLISLFRGGLIALLAGFLFQTGPGPGRAAPEALWLPAGLYLAAVILDAVDGWVARATGSTTRLGERLETEVDALGLLTASALAVWTGRAPVIFIAAGVGYYLLQAAIGLRRAMGRPILPIAPRPGARTAAGCAMGFTVAILTPAFEAPALYPAAWAITVALAIGFVQDWLVVCGFASAEGRPTQPAPARLQRRVERVVPLALRAGALGGVFLILRGGGGSCAIQDPSGFALALLGGGALMAALGVAARAAAVALCLVIADMTSGALLCAGTILAATSAALLIVTGAGRPRLWQPEGGVFLKRIGDRATPP